MIIAKVKISERLIPSSIKIIILHKILKEIDAKRNITQEIRKTVPIIFLEIEYAF